MSYPVLAEVAASMTDLKKDPMGTLRKGSGETVVILNRNEPVFYAVPPARYHAMLELIEDLRLTETVRERRGEPTERVDIDDLEKEINISTPSLAVKKAYFAQTRQSNYAASLRLEDFEVAKPKEDEQPSSKKASTPKARKPNA